MKILYVIIVLLMLPVDMLSQTFSMGHTSLTLIDTVRGNRKVPVEIYYPADSTGDNVPVSVSGSSKFPVLCFGHGYLMSWDSYKYLQEALVPNGFIIAFAKTEGELFPSHLDLAKDISFILRTIVEYGDDNRSIFFNRIQNKNCAMGHSMGGGSAVLAAEYDSAITALAILSPADTRPSAVRAAASIGIPSLIISGENDCITRPEEHQIPVFNALKSISKIMITIKGGSHCQMADKSFPCNLAELACGQNPGISRKEQQTIIIRYLLPWLNYRIKGDTASAREFERFRESDTTVVMNESINLIF